MKLLIDNWRTVALRAHSMWAQYLGLVFLVLPELLYLALGYDVAAPRFWFWLGCALILYGIIGRLKYQGIDK